MRGKLGKPMSFCGNCGSQIHEADKFCPGCGAAAPASVGAAAPNVQPPAPPVTVVQARSGAGTRIAIAALVILLVGGAGYWAYSAKQNASSKLNSVDASPAMNGSGGNESAPAPSTGNKPAASDQGSQDDPLSSLMGKLQGGGPSTPMGNMAKSILGDLGAKNGDVPPDLVRNIPYSALKSPLPCPAAGGPIDVARMASGKIQIKAGTVMTTSWSLPPGDLESDEEIQSVAPQNMAFQFRGPVVPGLDLHEARPAQLDNTVCGKDVTKGQTFSTGWKFETLDAPKSPGIFPGISRIVLHGKEFQSLKTTGTLPMVFAWYDYMDALTEWELAAWKGSLARVEPDDVPFPLIINDERVDVPAIHVRGQMKVIESGANFGDHDQPADAYILDDPATPVVLSWMFGENLKQEDSFRVRYIRVTYPSASKPTIEQKLAKDKRAVTYGIHFDFNKDTIRPDSEPILKEIVQAMNDNPDWKLTVEGHTDSIGGDAPNLDLSQRRAAAVKKALVDRYHIAPDRLVTSGYGRSRPVDTNETLEGRARNRRVELSRE